MSEDSGEIVALDAVRNSLASAKPMAGGAPAEKAASKDEVPENDGGEDRPRRKDGLDDECPFYALGRDADGKSFYYLNQLNQLTVLKSSDHNHNSFVALAGTEGQYLYDRWPQQKIIREKDEAGAEVERAITTGFNSGKVRDALMWAASNMGVFDPAARLRGRGAWRDAGGQLVLHCGNWLVTKEGDGLVHRKPGHYDGIVYSAQPPMPQPAAEPQPAGGGIDAELDAPAAELLEMLRSWQWARPDVDADLMLGWIGAAYLGGALSVRPIAWVTGDQQTGKSTLHNLLLALLGEGLVATGDTTSAGLYQRLGQSALAIAVDELEPDAENKRQSDLIKLARNAFSGTVVLRGGADHKGVEFQCRSAFLFSSILIPPLGAQDRSRMAILDLKPHEPGTKPPDLDAVRWRKVGQGLLRRLIDQWPRFDATLEAYATALARTGHDTRGCRQFGTLLAARDLLLSDVMPDEEVLGDWAERLSPAALGVEQEDSDAEKCLAHLLAAQPDAWRGGRRDSVAELIDQHVKMTDPATDMNLEGALATGGLRVIREADEWWLLVSNSHEGTRRLFDGTRWAGVAGLTGVWKQALQRLPGAKASKVARIAKAPQRATMVPVSLCLEQMPGGGR